MKQPDTETKSYADPLGEKIAGAQTAAQRHASRFASVSSVYDGYYTCFETDTRDGMSFLAGGEGVIGSEICYRLQSDCLQLVTHAGKLIAQLGDSDFERLRVRLDKGWQLTILLSLVIVDQTRHNHKAEVACLCYANDYAQALNEFSRNIAYRVGKGEHPGLLLSQDQFIRVVESNGAWYLTKPVPLPALEKGQGYYRRRRSAGEGLVAMAYQGRRGCKIAAIVFWVFFFLLLIMVIWWFFLS